MSANSIRRGVPVVGQWRGSSKIGWFGIYVRDKGKNIPVILISASFIFPFYSRVCPTELKHTCSDFWYILGPFCTQEGHPIPIRPRTWRRGWEQRRQEEDFSVASFASSLHRYGLRQSKAMVPPHINVTTTDTNIKTTNSIQAPHVWVYLVDCWWKM